jgi:hypothetical protein
MGDFENQSNEGQAGDEFWELIAHESWKSGDKEFDGIVTDETADNPQGGRYDIADVRRILHGAIELVGGLGVPAPEDRQENPALGVARQKTQEASRRLATSQLTELLEKDLINDDQLVQGLDSLIELDKSPEREGICLGDEQCAAPALPGLPSDMCAADAHEALGSLLEDDSEESDEEDDDPEELRQEATRLLRAHYDGSLRGAGNYQRLLELLPILPQENSEEACQEDYCDRQAITEFPDCPTHNLWSVSVAWRDAAKAAQNSSAA